MRQFLISIFLAVLVLAACGESQPLAPTFTSQPNTLTLTIQPSTPTSTSTPPPATATLSPTPTRSLPHDRSLIAYESGDPLDKRLILADPSDGTASEFSFPGGAIFATPFLAGLSPDARYFVYYEGGRVEAYGQLAAEPPDFVMHVYDLNRREVIFTASLLSPEFPEDLVPIVEMTEDEYWRVETDRQAKLKNMYETMQSTVLNYLRTVAWSPDGSLLAFASQNPGPSSDLNFFDPASGEARRVTSELGHVLELTWAPDA
jgi:hypothetical protein